MSRIPAWIRRLLSSTPLAIPESNAVVIAKQVSTERGWPWIEPINVKTRSGDYYISTNKSGIGCNIYVVIDGATGAVKSASFMKR